MFYIALGIVALLTLYNLLSLKSLQKTLREIKDSIPSQISWAKEDLKNDMTGMKTVMKVLAAGGRVTTDMVEDGKPYADISAAEAEKFLQSHPDTVVIDVRMIDHDEGQC